LPITRRNSDALRQRRIGVAIFAILFASYGYFHQGGGWNQNSRYNQVRAIVENQQLEINDYLRYHARVTSRGETKIFRLTNSASNEPNSAVISANTWDISVFAGRFYPNKPPGAVFLALPAYWLIYYTESLLHVDPTDWWIQIINSYLTNVFSIALFTALGGVVFYFLSGRLFPLLSAWTHIAATLTYGLGTLIFPFATLFFDHVLVATFPLCAFGVLLTKNQRGLESLRESFAYFLAGALCGLSIAVNYTAILVSGCLLVYGLWTATRKLTFVYSGFAGFLAPILLLMFYHAVCFGSPYAIANTYQYTMFRSPDTAFLGMLTLPSLTVAFELLFPYYRGLFFTSPVLLLAALGLVIMASDRRRRAEAILCVSVFAVYLLMNSAFNHWHAGWTVGPRYLIPALPFLALPGALLFTRLPRLTGVLALASVCVMLLITAVEPQVPSSIRNPLKDHVLRLALGARLEVNGISIEGPVSTNPIGPYESWDTPGDSIGRAQRRWHAFNLGEFIWPGSLWSLAPLILFVSGALVYIRWVLKVGAKGVIR
jgi:hypothetical protein